MRTVFFIPSLHKLSGGLATIYVIADLLAELGHAVALTHLEGQVPAGLAETALPVLPWEQISLAPGDIWCVPESWPNAISPGVQAGARTVVYAQSWVYMLGNLPAKVRWKQLPVEYLAVSRPVKHFMEEVLDLPVRAVLPPVVHNCFFTTPAQPEDRVRIAWMPRKNRALALQIQQIAWERLHKSPGHPQVEWVALDNLSQAELAAALSTCHIFLASSCVEGFGLPPLEAMACGCIPVGFTAFGGWEYMRQAPFCPAAATFTPHFPLHRVPWGPNGFYVPDGDVISAGLALAQAIQMAHTRALAWQELEREALKTAQAYTKATMRQTLQEIWK